MYYICIEKKALSMEILFTKFIECIVYSIICIVCVGFSANYTLYNYVINNNLPLPMYSMYSFFLKKGLIYNIYRINFFPLKPYILYTTFLQPCADAPFRGVGFFSNYTLNYTFLIKNHTL